METKELEQLLNQAKQGDQQALTALYEQTQGYAYFVARRYLQNDEDVKDALQDAYIAAFSRLDTLQESGAFLGWLGRIVTNHCLNQLRKKKAVPVSDDILGDLADDEELIPAAWLEREEKRKEILHIIDSLPAGQRIAIVLFYLEGLSIAEIAEQMELATGTVKAQLYNGRKAIKAAVLKEEEKGNKLYGLVAIPLLTQLMRIEAQAAEMPPHLSGVILENTLRAMRIGAGAGSGASGTSSTKSGSFFSKLSTQTKVIAGVLAAVLIGGGIWLAGGARRAEIVPQEVPELQEASQEQAVSQPEPEPEPEPDPDFEVSFGSESLESMLRQALSLASGPIMNSDLEDVTELAVVGGEILIVNGEGAYELERGTVEHKILVAPGQYSTTTIDSGVEACLYKAREEDEGIAVERGTWGDFADFANIPNLEKLEIVYCNIEDWNDISAMLHGESLKELSLETSVLPEGDIAPLAAFTELEGLNLSETNVREFSAVAQLRNLKNFYARDCEITEIGFLEGLDLEVLQVGVNEIEDISVLAPMSGMKELDLQLNAVSDISSLSSMKDLKELNLWMNAVEDLSPLADAKQLHKLELSSNRISDLSAFSGLTELEVFSIDSNALTDISFLQDSPKLTVLNVANNQIVDISVVAGLQELETLNLAMNPITTIEPVRGLTGLTNLRFFTCPGISDITPVAELVNLTMLQMGGCSISDLSPLQNLVALEDLRIYSNPISDLSVVAGLPNLRHIDAYTTYITDWSPASHVEMVLH